MATGVKGLLVWCKNIAQYYENAPVSNMTTSWKNGLAFCAIIHYYRPDLIDYQSLDEKNVAENNLLAFRIAEEQFGIPALLDVEDMVKMSVPDRLSIMTYLSQYYNYFKDKTPGDSSRSSRKRPNEWSHSLPVEKRASNVQKTYTEKQSSASYCHSCGKVVYLMERVVVEGFIFHRVCFKCHFCGNLLKSTTYKMSEEKRFCCEKHSFDKVKKPEEVEFTDEPKSAECLKECEKQIDASPFRRNEVFTRRGLRPQSTPVDIYCDQSYTIKSGENVLQPSISSVPKAKTNLVNILKRKESEETSFEFNNPAYQHHLDLSAYMNRLNQSEPNLVHNKEKKTESVECHKDLKTPNVSPARGVSPSKDNLSSSENSCEKISVKESKKPDNILSVDENCQKSVDMNSQMKKLPDNLLFFKGDCEQTTDIGIHKRKLVLRKKKKGALKESFLKQKLSENDDAGLVTPCKATSESSGSSCNNYENITSLKEKAIISDHDSKPSLLSEDSKPSENDYERINYFEIISSPKELEDSIEKKENTTNVTSKPSLSSENLYEEINYFEIKPSSTENKEIDGTENEEIFLPENKNEHTNGCKNIAANNSQLSEKNENRKTNNESRCSEKSNNPFESSDSEPDTNSKLSNSNLFLGLVDDLADKNSNNANNFSDATLNPFLSDSDDLNNSNPFLCGSSDEDEAVMAVNKDNFYKKLGEQTMFRSPLYSSKKRIAPSPPVRTSNDKSSVVPKPSVRNLKNISSPTADPRLSICSSTNVSQSSINSDISVQNKIVTKAPSVKKRAPNPPPNCPPSEIPPNPPPNCPSSVIPPNPIPNSRPTNIPPYPPPKSPPPNIPSNSPPKSPPSNIPPIPPPNSPPPQIPLNPRPNSAEKSILNEKVERVKSIINNVLSPSLQNNQESVENINRSQIISINETVHSQNQDNFNLNRNTDLSRQSISSGRQSTRRKAPERPVKPPVHFEEGITEHELTLKGNLAKIEIIENELSHIEQHQGILEMEGVEMEKKLRECQNGEQEETYLIEWFQLVNKKNSLFRKENELIYMLQDIQLLNQQRESEFQLRQMMLKPESMRSEAEKQYENHLLETILLLVSKRSAIVDRLEEERLKETEEDTEINVMMSGLSSPSKSVTSAPATLPTKEKKKKKNKILKKK